MRPRRAVRELRLKLTAHSKVKALAKDASLQRLPRQPVLLGELDQFGGLVAREAEDHLCGACHSRPPLADAENHVKRTRARLELLCTGRALAIRKTFHGHEAERRFAHEVRVVNLLGNSDCRIPAVLAIDPAALSLTTEYLGVSIEQLLVEAGARLTGVELSAMAGRPLSLSEIHTAYYLEGSRVVRQTGVVDPDRVLNLVRAAHRKGVTLREVSYSNLVRSADGRLALIDFEAATVHPRPSSTSCLIDRDRDLESFNRAFGGSALTRQRIRQTIRAGKRPLSDIYGVSYIGHGIGLGRAFNPSSGFGKWNFVLRRQFGDLTAKSVLSLGANNCSIELQMLRSGAAKVTAYELGAEYREQARFLKEAVEWADNRVYDLEIRAGNMTDVIEDHGSYDLAMALCSLYYLPESDMRRVLEHLALHAEEVVLQCNTGQNIGREDHDQYRRASVGFTEALALESGFEAPISLAPAHYSRPVVRAKSSPNPGGAVIELRDSGVTQRLGAFTDRPSPRPR